MLLDRAINRIRAACWLTRLLKEGAIVAITGTTRLYGIIGDPIAQVKSPALFNALFAGRGDDAAMLPVNVRPSDFDEALRGLACVSNLDGIVLTIPFKFAGSRHCVHLSRRARLLGAVNVMRRTPDRLWEGDMLDGLGYVDALRRKGYEPRGRSALVVGAGGAGTAIAVALAEAGASRIVVSDLDTARRDALLATLARVTPYAQAGDPDPGGVDLAINATPSGMAPGDPLPFDPLRLRPETFVGEVITAPEVTELLQAARARGCRTLTGGEMFDGVLGWMDKFFLRQGG